MTLVLETGAGVQDGNSYFTAAFVTAYLTARNRETENLWSTLGATVQEAHCILSTQYIDTRWGPRFRGVRAIFFDGQAAIATLTFSGNPSAAETVTIGDYTYTFVAALTETNNFEVLVGASQADTMDNLVAAVNEAAPATAYSTTLIVNQNASVAVDDTDTDVINLTALQEGDSGNDIALTETSGVIVAVGFANGRDAGSQPLEFPRISLFDPEGIRVIGIPRRLKEAGAEYAVRNAGANLYADPSVDASGLIVKRRKIGPIDITFQDGSSLTNLIKPYPAADRLLQNYVFPAGRVFRG